MTGSSDGLIRFWENEGDALSIAKKKLQLFYCIYLCTLFRKKRVLAYLHTTEKHTIYQ
jgi:hypothetical protein